jgi:hypothetical protein
MNNNSGYHIERISETRLKDIETLYEAVYGHKSSKNYFLKKYNTAFTGTQYIGHIAYDQENIPIAFFNVIPCLIQYNDKIILSAQATDAMSHPLYRYKGLFEQLANATFDLCKATGIKLLFGFPNQNSYHGLVYKLQWRVIENLQLFVIPVKTFPFESLLRNIGAKKIYNKYTQWSLRKHQTSQHGLSNPLITEGFAGIYRDNEYLEYKSYSDTQVIQVGKTKVWIAIKNNLILGDLDVTEEDFDKVMVTINQIAKQLGLSGISFQTSPGTRLHALFASKYKPTTSFPVIFFDLDSGIPSDKLKFTFADIDIF